MKMKTFQFRNIMASAVLLGLFAIIGTGLVAVTHEQTKDRIFHNERNALLKSLNAIIPKSKHDNDMFLDSMKLHDPTLLGSKTPVSIYRARKQGEPVAVVIASVAPNGYNGAINLLVGIYKNGELAGVRVVKHHETPGLGDAIEADRSNWILSFQGQSLDNTPEDQWAVKKDGGRFDQFTGATITPRAIVTAVYKTLLFYKLHKDLLYRSEPANEAKETQASGQNHGPTVRPPPNDTASAQ